MNGKMVLNTVLLVGTISILMIMLMNPVMAAPPYIKTDQVPVSYFPGSANISFYNGSTMSYHNTTPEARYLCGWDTDVNEPAMPRNCLGGTYLTDGTVHDFFVESKVICSGGVACKWYGYQVYTTAAVLIKWQNSSIPNYNIPVANFTGVPCYGFAPLSVTFTDTSTNSQTSWFWEASMAGTIHTATTQNWIVPLEVGNWRINLTATNSAGNNITSKAAYVWVSGGEGNYTVVNLDIKNAVTGALIQDATCGIRNTTSGAWRNGTAPTGLIYYDATGAAWEYPLSVGQTITLAAGATGYRPNWHNLTIPYSDYRDYLYLIPSSITPAANNGTVVIAVISNKNGNPISGASVVLDSGQIGSTNSAGAVTFLNVTAGSRTVTVSTPDYGYQSTSKIFSLASGESTFIIIQLVMVGETPVPTFQPTASPTDSGDLNAYGASFLQDWARMAIAFGGVIFLLVFVYFVRKVTK